MLKCRKYVLTHAVVQVRTVDGILMIIEQVKLCTIPGTFKAMAPNKFSDVWDNL